MSDTGNERRQQHHLLSPRCDLGHQRHQAIFGKNGHRAALILPARPVAQSPCRTGPGLGRVGHLHLPRLGAASEAHFTKNVTAASQDEDQKVA